jgi:hypothetical protein
MRLSGNVVFSDLLGGSVWTCSRHRSQLAFCRPARTVVARQLCAGSASNSPPGPESCSALIPVDGCTYALESDAQGPRSELPPGRTDSSAPRIPEERCVVPKYSYSELR